MWRNNQPSKPIKYLRGGIGDILIRLGNIKPTEHYKIISHFPQAGDLVRPYTLDYEFIPMIVPIGTMLNEVAPQVYPHMRIPQESIDKAKATLNTSKKLIGIHPVGSKISRDVDDRLGRPSKLMTSSFITQLISSLSSPDTELLLFCGPNEKQHYDSFGIRVIAEEDIWECFAYVSLCNLMIATESALKTMSAILHIPTIVLLGNFEDPYRKLFIDPYKEIIPVKFDNIDEVLDETILKAKQILK